MFSMRMRLMACKLSIYDRSDRIDRYHLPDRLGADDDVQILPVGSVGELREALDGLVAKAATFDRLSFRTRGYPGMIFLGHEEITAGDLRTRFAGRNYRRLFPFFTRIRFHGCNVARNEAGTRFLRAAGEVFLRGLGGQTSGFTNVGPGLPGWLPTIGGHPVHLLGTLKRLDFGPGGMLFPEPPVSFLDPTRSGDHFGCRI
jgi:hypothetical protein